MTWQIGISSFHSISFPNEWGEKVAFLNSSLKINVSIQLVSPTSGEEVRASQLCILAQVSIQLVSPTSGEVGTHRLASPQGYEVSIQLVSPTSGESLVFQKCSRCSGDCPSFHSISFPNEWGVGSTLSNMEKLGFHSISFPNEWGVRQSSRSLPLPLNVSIQLVSPTSGEILTFYDSRIR